jgi:hypothetical protein
MEYIHVEWECAGSWLVGWLVVVILWWKGVVDPGEHPSNEPKVKWGWEVAPSIRSQWDGVGSVDDVLRESKN